MTRKDYRLLAKILSDAITESTKQTLCPILKPNTICLMSVRVVLKMAQEMCKVLKEDNPRFNPQSFMDAVQEKGK